MKKKLLFIVLILCFISGRATDRHFAIGGSDASGTGTAGNPFASLGKAASVAVAGDVIRPGAGTFNQTTQVIIAPSVDLIGPGAWLTRINLSFNVTGSNGYNSAAIQLVTASVNNNIGNQTISGIWFDGNNFACYNGILVRCRSNVIFSYCKFTNFGIAAIAFNGKTSNVTGQPPAIFSQGNQVLNSSFYDCNSRILQTTNSISSGSISYAGQRNLLFQYDTLINVNRTQGNNGNLFGGVQGNNIGTKWLNNIFQKPPDEGNQFNFGIENWYDQGGTIYAYNTYTGGGNAIDIGYGSANKGDSAYSWYIHDNLFTNPALLTGTPGTQPVLSMAIQFEAVTRVASLPGIPQNATIGDAIITNNYCKNMGIFVQIGLSNYALDFIDNVYINHNVCENMGFANNTYASVFQFSLNNGARINNIFVDNNTITGAPGAGAPKGIMILQNDAGVIENIYFRNNIAVGTTPIPTGTASGYGYLVFRGSIASTDIFSQNNIVFQNAFTNNHFVFPGSPSPINFTNSGNLKVNPQFVKSTPVVDYHLAAGSPGINGGLNPPATYIGAYPAAATNIAPIANAGSNQNITLPTSSVSQVGSGTDPDGSITGYLWSRISGPATYTIVSPTSATTTINNLVAGTYVFQLRVTDNLGLTGIDQATVVVNAAPPANVPPIANAGGNKSIQLPTSTVTQVGSGTDSDGSIVSYSWVKSSGPATYNIVSPTSATTVINNLTTAGVYVFTLTVTDNLGATGTSTATITVNSATNINPNANAGANQSITWPTNSTTLNGSGSDPDGTIVGYSWTKISGGAATISSSGSASTALTSMEVGVYQFQLTVIDNSGGTATDVMQVTVGKGSATIGLSNLTQVFTGSPLSPTVTTNPAGLAYSLTLAGTSGGKTLVGSYPAIAGISDPNWNFTPASATFTITKGTAVINASPATFNFDGLTHSIVATTTPAGLTGLSYTYDGSPTAPSAIGVYDEQITLTNANWQATPVNVNMSIVSNPAIIFISDTVFVHDGLSHGVTVTSQWPYSLTGSPHTQAGVYPVTATINDGIHTGSASANLTITKRPAVLSWPNPVPIPYGSMLTTSILNATADISGTWTYSYPLGTVLPIGVTSITATFTPLDTTNKTGGSLIRSVSVFGVNPFLDYFISSNGKYFFVEQ